PPQARRAPLRLRQPAGRQRALPAGLVPRTRSSHHIAAGTVANFGFKSGTRIIAFLVSFSIPKIAQNSRQMLANFGIGALEHFSEEWTPVFRRKCDQTKEPRALISSAAAARSPARAAPPGSRICAAPPRRRARPSPTRPRPCPTASRARLRRRTTSDRAPV